MRNPRSLETCRGGIRPDMERAGQVVLRPDSGMGIKIVPHIFATLWGRPLAGPFGLRDYGISVVFCNSPCFFAQDRGF